MMNLKVCTMILFVDAMVMNGLSKLECIELNKKTYITVVHFMFTAVFMPKNCCP